MVVLLGGRWFHFITWRKILFSRWNPSNFGIPPLVVRAKQTERIAKEPQHFRCFQRTTSVELQDVEDCVCQHLVFLAHLLECKAKLALPLGIEWFVKIRIAKRRLRDPDLDKPLDTEGQRKLRLAFEEVSQENEMPANAVFEHPANWGIIRWKHRKCCSSFAIRSVCFARTTAVAVQSCWGSTKRICAR